MHIPSRILRSQLIALFCLTIISLFAFYYSDSLGDNYQAISSNSESINYFSYYLSSSIVWAGYYTGPWIVFVFVVFSIFYSFLYRQREDWIDTLNALSLGVFTFSLTAILYPKIIGSGLLSFAHFWLDDVAMISLAVVTFIAFMFGSFRSSFHQNLILFSKAMWASVLWIQDRVLTPAFSFFAKNLPDKKNKLQQAMQVGLPKLLKGGQSDVEKSSEGSFHYSHEEIAMTKPSRKRKETEAPLLESAGIDDKELEMAVHQFDQDEEFEEEDFRDDDDYTDEPATKVTKPKRSPMNDPKIEKQYFEIVSTLSQRKTNYQPSHPDDIYFQDIIRRIEDKLSEFKIEGRVINVLKGPVVDTFEVELGSGVKVSKVTNSEKDLSMALLGAPIRIVYPMIGRTTVGIEVPRNPREFILLEEVLNSDEYKKSNLALPVAMGKNAYGEVFVVDLAAMPHMLVAGATGAGKSVFINSLLVSLLAKKSPQQMKLILIDPKQLELALYAKLPHLVMPVITDAKMAAIALLWACQEMERRYSILKEFGVRNIEGFNQKLQRATPELLASIRQHYDDQDHENYELPYLVIIVDEFADLILTKAGKEIENNICRLAAKARAAGIHLVIATQRPSVDVITGLIKSNFPTRVSFRVTSAVDSRTILNSIGAEKLLGKGDMLYKYGTASFRVHSSFVDEEEIEVLTDQLAALPQNYHTGAIDFLENGGTEERDSYSFGTHIPSSTPTDGSSDDDLYREAVRIVVEHRTASASMLQRRLRVGYNRAANLIEEMESRGVVGPAEGSKRRKVLVAPDELR